MVTVLPAVRTAVAALHPWVMGHWLVSEASAMEYARRKRARLQRREEKAARKQERRAEMEHCNREFQALRAK